MNLLVSYNWLKDHVRLDSSPQEFAARLSLSGPSVERIHPQAAALDKVVVGRIVAVKPHPDPKTTKLRVVETDLGTMTKDIVCGGSNLAEGQLVAVALPGSWVKWHGEGEPVEIKETVLRGAPSYGMICGADEIGLLERFPKSDEKEIVDLTSLAAAPGTPLADALGLDDVIFDVEITSNRPDAYCLVGMARETSAIFGAPMTWTEPRMPAKGTASLPLSVDVRSPKLCPRYQAVALSGVKVGPSPAWMRERLASAGVRSINNLVDITNYVRLELGQPMHVFDHAKLSGAAIVVREAEAGEKLKALDGLDYALKPGQLVIADAAGPVAVAGVMGGEASGVTETTTDVVFESATFDPVSVRRTARDLNLHSDSSKLYEKGLSTELTAVALARAAELAVELCGAEVASDVVDARAAAYERLVFPFRPARAAELIGVAIPGAEMRRILVALGFGVEGDGESWSVSVPSWRDRDIEGERDLVEEVARVYGYGNLPSAMPEGRLPLGAADPALALEDRAKRLLKAWGHVELMTYSFISKDLAAKSGCGEGTMLRVSNPLSEEYEFMRDRLVGSVLKVVAENQEEAVEGRCFELSNVYLPRPDDLPLEVPRLMIASWSRDASGRDTLAVKGTVEALFAEFGIQGVTVVRGVGNAVWHPGRSATWEVDGRMLGGFGEFHPDYLKRFGIERRVAGASLDFALLASLARDAKVYRPIPEFPRVKRDLAFTVGRRTEHAAIVQALREADPPLTSVELFDVYEGPSLGEGKKSLAYHLEFGVADRTLKADEVDRVMEALRARLTETFGAEVRS